MNLFELIAPFRKAVVSAVVVAIVSWLGRKGFDANNVSVADGLRTLLDAAIGFVTVWFTKNKVGAIERKK